MMPKENYRSMSLIKCNHILFLRIPRYTRILTPAWSFPRFPFPAQPLHDLSHQPVSASHPLQKWALVAQECCPLGLVNSGNLVLRSAQSKCGQRQIPRIL